MKVGKPWTAARPAKPAARPAAKERRSGFPAFQSAASFQKKRSARKIAVWNQTCTCPEKNCRTRARSRQTKERSKKQARHWDAVGQARFRKWTAKRMAAGIQAYPER